MIFTVLYPNAPGRHFDKDYYRTKHIPLLKERWRSFGMGNVTVLHGGEGAAFHTIALVEFDSAENFARAREAHGAEAAADVPNFTNIEPIRQISEIDQ